LEKSKVILIVDDNRNFVDRIKIILEESTNVGEIFSASCYEETSQLLKDIDPDIVLLDINMAGKNGIEVLKMIKKTKQNCDVIMITNHAEDYYRHQCMELGANYFLDKSLDFALVPGIINKCIEKRN
jgi:DNA-binding NarL/FixJ family response regulator